MKMHIFLFPSEDSLGIPQDSEGFVRPPRIFTNSHRFCRILGVPIDFSRIQRKLNMWHQKSSKLQQRQKFRVSQGKSGWVQVSPGKSGGVRGSPGEWQKWQFWLGQKPKNAYFFKIPGALLPIFKIKNQENYIFFKIPGALQNVFAVLLALWWFLGSDHSGEPSKAFKTSENL